MVNSNVPCQNDQHMEMYVTRSYMNMMYTRAWGLPKGLYKEDDERVEERITKNGRGEEMMKEIRREMR